MSTKRVVIIEDERDIADLVAMRLQKEGYQVDVAYDGDQGLEKILSTPPDLVLLDLMLPGMSGTEVAAAVRRDPRTAEVPIVILTARNRESDIIAGFGFGADDYITKPFSMSVLLVRIDAVLRRASARREAGKGILTVGPISIDSHRHEVHVAGRPAVLTLAEFNLLAALAAAHGEVLSRGQLMEQALGVGAFVTSRTVDVHMTSLRKKLGSARGYLQTVRGVGYKLEAPRESETLHEGSPCPSESVR
jgi:two-component system phosphate regulon response regulator PhoB